MAEVILITHTLNAFGEEVEASRHPMWVTIDRINNEKVTEGRNERRGYDMVCFVQTPDVPEGVSLMNTSYLIEYEGKRYEPKNTHFQHNFAGKGVVYELKLQLA
jgi:hypothetical protein